MKINNVNNRPDFIQGPKQDRKVESKKSQISDKVEISFNGKLMAEKSNMKKPDEIQDRIKSGFYEKPEVLAKVADAILKELSGK